ncbi:MAG: hypothetical protein LBP98_06070 [Tannerella sp.]|jgi:hypothetical protein|nr:hypothetical protein [Tannerella sp.]
MKAEKKLFILLLCVAAAGCHKKTDDTNLTTCQKVGMIEYCPPPDNCNDYMIVFDTDQLDKKYYKPDHLPDDFKINNLQIEVTYRITEEKHNCGFGGDVPVIHIIKIRKL